MSNSYNPLSGLQSAVGQSSVGPYNFAPSTGGAVVGGGIAAVPGQPNSGVSPSGLTALQQLQAQANAQQQTGQYAPPQGPLAGFFNAQGQNTQAGQVALGGVPTNGMYGQNLTTGQLMNDAAQKWSLQNMPDYSDYQALGSAAQQYGAQGQNVLNQSAPGIQQGLSAQQAATGTSAQQAQGVGQQLNGLNMLNATATGNGPNVAGMASQQATSQALQAQLAAGASARGGAYAQAAAQQQAGRNAAGVQAQAAGQASLTAAQQQLTAQQQYAQAAQGLSTVANQAQSVAGTNAANLTQSQLANQQAGLQYYEGQQTAYQQQQQMAANLATSQLNADYGLSGTALQTQTQQNIANQQQQTQLASGAAGATAGLIGLAALSDVRLKDVIAPQGDRGVADAFLDALAKSKATFVYRSPADQPVSTPRHAKARFGGVMAQALEAVPEIGRQLVSDTPRGKRLEGASVQSASLMGLGRLAERLAKVEAAVR
jgi:hypothetical protein